WHHVESVRLHRYGLGRRSEMDRSDAIAEVALSQLALAGAHSGAVLSPPSLAAHGEAFVDGVSAAAPGAIGGPAYGVGTRALTDVVTVAVAVATFVVLSKWKI